MTTTATTSNQVNILRTNLEKKKGGEITARQKTRATTRTKLGRGARRIANPASYVENQEAEGKPRSGGKERSMEKEQTGAGELLNISKTSAVRGIRVSLRKKRKSWNEKKRGRGNFKKEVYPSQSRGRRKMGEIVLGFLPEELLASAEEWKGKSFGKKGRKTYNTKERRERPQVIKFYLYRPSEKITYC